MRNPVAYVLLKVLFAAARSPVSGNDPGHELIWSSTIRRDRLCTTYSM